MLANGATTLWERWELMNGNGMNSHNHPMMGSVSAWFYKYLAGINVDPNAPGFKRFIVRPLFRWAILRLFVPGMPPCMDRFEATGARRMVSCI